MEVEKTRQYILTFWLSTTNGAESREKTLFEGNLETKSIRLSS